jgi:hypothetical protein
MIGIIDDVRITMITITTISSIRVKPLRFAAPREPRDVGAPAPVGRRRKYVARILELPLMTCACLPIAPAANAGRLA